MNQAAPNLTYQEPSTTFYGHKLKAVTLFVQSSGTLIMTGTHHDEICLQISKVNVAFGKVEKQLGRLLL